jgi:hypothetical protein
MAAPDTFAHEPGALEVAPLGNGKAPRGGELREEFVFPVGECARGLLHLLHGRSLRQAGSSTSV